MTDSGFNQDDLRREPPRVTCVVLNWNGWRDTIPCVASLRAQEYPELEVLVVDNASTDDSVEQIRSALPGVEIVEAGENRGFAAGCNVGTRLALQRGADFVWLLNNDIVTPADTLTRLIAASSDPKIGMVGTVLYYQHEPTRVQAWGGGSLARMTGFVRHFYTPTALPPDSFVTFASVLLRRELLLTVGLLDEGFFMYFEDADLCFRAQDAGWRLAVAEETAVLHKEGGSGGPRRNPARDRTVTASGLRFLSSHGRPRVLAMTLYLLLRLGRRAVRGDITMVRAVLAGVADWRTAQKTG